MPLPSEVMELLSKPMVTKVIATISPDGIPHAINVASITPVSPETIGLAEIFMKKTHENLKYALEKKSKVAIVVVEKMKSYQVICEVAGYETSGPIFSKFDESLSKMGLKPKGVWLLKVLEVFDQSPGPNAGKKIS